MPVLTPNTRKWIFAVLLAMPVYFLYALHFFNHDAALKPTGYIQWEHLMYMLSAKEYASGNAQLLYQWPMLNNFDAGPVFFQPQFLVLGYVWKFTGASPATLLLVFNIIFAVLTLRVVIAVIDVIIPQYRYKNLITILFCWGGGLLAAAGFVLHWVVFKNSTLTFSEQIFYLDPADGFWCLNFGRTLIYPFEAYYHFLFVSAVLMVLRKRFMAAFVIILLLILSHPYTAIELITPLLVWIAAEVFYFKNSAYSKRQFWLFAAAFLLFFIFYAGILGRIEIYRYINQLNSLDWNYKAWHFVPGYALVWLLSFYCIKNVPALKRHFSNPHSRLFFWWGLVAFLLSVHGFAIKPEQPVHFTRGYVYAGFFLFSIPALQQLISWLMQENKKKYLLTTVIVFVFLFDNISWFGLKADSKNQAGVYFNKPEYELIDFFSKQPAAGIVAGNENNYPLNIAIQLHSNTKAWIPHPFLGFDIEERRQAVAQFVSGKEMHPMWRGKTVYMYFDKNDGNLQQPPVFENAQFVVYKINE
ncbi:MAG TPA: hypothetical protein PKC39_06185 [Ferruginibacter sp.]|nr:hypothetical protein [Ferruginibacter sp.]HMP20531.1 hypothetical protein [Ferruginibacter sp.]